MLGRFQHVIAYASLHRLDRDLFAAGSGEHDHRGQSGQKPLMVPSTVKPSVQPIW
jgi:hypothetical protein